MKPKTACAVITFALVVTIGTLGFTSRVSAQVGLAEPVGAELLAALRQFVASEPAKTLAGEVAQSGGMTAIRELSARIVQDGGESALRQAAHITEELGPTAIKALIEMPHPSSLLAALDGLPPEVARKAISALSRGADGQATAEAINRYGARALRLELQHPGVGTRIAQDLGDGGIEVARQLPTDQAIIFARHSREIAGLPEAQKTALLEGATKHAANFIRFLEDNPKFLFTAATTAVVLEEKDQIFGDSKIVADVHGNPITVVRPGLIERVFQAFLDAIKDTILVPVGWAIALVIGGWGTMRLWFLCRRLRFCESRVQSSRSHNARAI
jgi:hypothetical protein